MARGPPRNPRKTDRLIDVGGDIARFFFEIADIAEDVRRVKSGFFILRRDILPKCGEIPHFEFRVILAILDNLHPLYF